MFPNHPTSLISQQIISDFGCLNAVVSTSISPNQPQLPVHESQKKIKKKRSLPGNPDPEAEVIALSPKTLLATNRFVCEICNKGFKRDQNLQLHRRGHNLPWKLKQRKEAGGMMRKRVYVCPEASCVHHHPSRALGDLTGIKKHYCRKHGEKKWKCDKCDKIYAVHSDWKAHSKTCGTREYRCDCGTHFSRKDSFITHRAFCDALAEESARISASRAATYPDLHHRFAASIAKTISYPSPDLLSFPPKKPNPNPNVHMKPETTPSDQYDHHHYSSSSLLFQLLDPTKTATVPSPFHAATTNLPHLSATALLQKAATVGSTATQLNSMGPPGQLAAWQKKDWLTRDFLGLAAGGGVSVNVSINVSEMLTSTSYAAGGLELRQQQQQQGYTFAAPETWGNCC